MSEPMSIATFEPDRSFAPYLNTPRSLEACRLHGINPVELVAVPIAEFHKDFPNDPDAATRRFERIDGARRRVLQDVKQEWKRLCSINWKPPTSQRPKSAHEAILNVPAEAHSTLLELQAQRFRKMEEENWNQYNRILKMEVKKADAEVQNKKILEKHQDIQISLDLVKKERMMNREAIQKEERDRIARKEAAEAAEIKALQEMDAAYAQQKKHEAIQLKKMEKEAIIKREADRLSREQYTRQMKESIFHNVESKISNRKKVREMRDKLIEDRLIAFKNDKAKNTEDKRLAMEAKLQKVREDIARSDEEERLAAIRRIQEDEEYRLKIQAMRSDARRDAHTGNDNATREKMEHILGVKEQIDREKQNKVLAEMQLKEELARQELDKVKQAQDKRMCIKSIRQESYAIAAARARKTKEYKMMKLEETIKNKEDRCNAIKKGFTVLSQMRNSMKDIMEKTTTELKTEMHRLRHTDQFDPNNVVEKALEVSDRQLFPRLEKTFGILDPNAPSTSHNFAQSSNLFGFDFDSTKQSKGRAIDTMAMGKSMKQGENTSPKSPDPRGATAPANPTAQSRTNFATMHIQSLTHDRLAKALNESKAKYTGGNGSRPQENVYGSSRGHTQKSTSSHASPHRKSKHDRSILKLDPEDYVDGMFSDEEEGEEEVNGRGRDSRERQRDEEEDEEVKEDKSFSPNRSGEQRGGGSSSRGGEKLRGPRAASSPAHTKNSKHPPLPHGKSTGSIATNSNRTQLQPLTTADDSSSRPVSSSMRFNIHQGNNNNSLEEGSQEGSLEGEEGLGGGRDDNSSRGSWFNQNLDRSSKSITLQPIKSPHKTAADYLKEAHKPVRTDVNIKAKYLPPGEGKFRREFSLDHPLAKDGTGRYNKELKKGILPEGMDVPTKVDATLAATLQTATKIERLTYTASTKVVDPEMQLEKIKKEQNLVLKNIIDEERHNEEVRDRMSNTINDVEERSRMDSIFAEERRRASERIITATKEHEQNIKTAVLAMMNLGTSGGGSGRK